MKFAGIVRFGFQIVLYEFHRNRTNGYRKRTIEYTAISQKPFVGFIHNIQGLYGLFSK